MNWFRPRFRVAPRCPRPLALRLGELSPRIVPAVIATFAAGAGILSVFGDAQDNAITVSRDAAGQLLVNGGTVAIRGATPTAANTTQIQVFGQAGNDTITLDEANGVLPPAHLFGGAGIDTMQFNGANIDEKIDVSANGGRVRFTRDVGGIVMDVNGTEVIAFDALGGVDEITVHDLSGTDATEVNLNLAVTGGAGDGAADSVIVEGTAGDDVATVTGDASGTSVGGLAARVNVAGAEATDRLAVNAGDGDDVVEGSGLSATAIQFTANGEAGDDELLGGAGDDTLAGGDGDDVLIGGPGQDALDGGAGDNIVIQ